MSIEDDLRNSQAKHYENLTALLAGLKKNLPELKELLTEANSHWTYEDGIYRFYHQSFKVFYLQGVTKQICGALRAVMPDREPNKMWMSIFLAGTAGRFDMERTNANWVPETVPITTAFMHAKFFLEMACKYGEAFTEEDLRMSMPSGWAALLCFYNLR